jgi:hypothetical protein
MDSTARTSGTGQEFKEGTIAWEELPAGAGGEVAQARLRAFHTSSQGQRRDHSRLTNG